MREALSPMAQHGVSMPVYFIAEVEIERPELYAHHIGIATQFIERFGGRYVFRSESIDSVSGNWKPGWMIVIEFDNKAKVFECFSSDEYFRSHHYEKTRLNSDRSLWNAKYRHSGSRIAVCSIAA